MIIWSYRKTEGQKGAGQASHEDWRRVALREGLSAHNRIVEIRKCLTHQADEALAATSYQNQPGLVALLT